jgi:hypothetical protein
MCLIALGGAGTARNPTTAKAHAVAPSAADALAIARE